MAFSSASMTRAQQAGARVPLSRAAAARRPPPLLLAAPTPTPTPTSSSVGRHRRRSHAPLCRAQGSDHQSPNNNNTPQSDADFDLAVFRFTLGIPGFEDRLVPRVVGLVAAALVALNHALGGEPAPAQLRAELVDAVLAALCFVLPDVEEKLQEVAGASRGRRASAAAAAGTGAGGAAGFWLVEASALAGGEAARRELAWASFALLRNTNSLAVLAFGPGGQAVMARGSLAAAAVDGGANAAAAVLAAASRDAAGGGGEVGALLTGGEAGSSTSSSSLWLPDRASMARAGLDRWATLPGAAQSALVVSAGVAGGGAAAAQGSSGSKKGEVAPCPVALVALSDRIDGLTLKDRKWVEAIADKLAGAGVASAVAGAAAGGKKAAAA
jgi:hypothetical protein